MGPPVPITLNPAYLTADRSLASEHRLVDFLDAVPDPPRAAAAIERLRPALGTDGTIAVSGGTEDEHITPIDLSERPDAPSRGCSPRTRSTMTSTGSS